MRTKSREQFIEEANNLHGGRYDYSSTHYVNSRTILTVVCPVHGPWETTPKRHLGLRHGCIGCAGKLPKSTEDFKEAAAIVHNGKYDYSLVEYNARNKKVLIKCQAHGVFEQIPADHLKGRGCQACAGMAKHTAESFKSAAKAVHGNKYDYTAVRVRGYEVPVQISCPAHGVFSQKPREHLNGSGCQSCAKTGFKTEGEAYLYVLKIVGESSSFTGYGITAQPERRIAKHKSRLKLKGFEIAACCLLKGEAVLVEKVEREIKKKFTLVPQQVLGFVREATTVEDYMSVLTFAVSRVEVGP